MNEEVLSSQILGKRFSEFPSRSWTHDHLEYQLERSNHQGIEYLWWAELYTGYITHKNPVVRAFQQVFWMVVGSTPVGELRKSFSKYLTWEHFFTHFQFIQVIISLIFFIFHSVFLLNKLKILSWNENWEFSVFFSEPLPTMATKQVPFKLSNIVYW